MTTSFSRLNSFKLIEADTKFGYLNRRTPADREKNPVLVDNTPENTMRAALYAELKNQPPEFVFSVAFVTNDGIGKIKQALLAFEGKGTIITSDYQYFNTPDAFWELLQLPNIDVRIASGISHHAKGFVFRYEDHITAIIGSSNLTQYALTKNQEWNLKFSTYRDGEVVDQLDRALQHHMRMSKPLTEEWIEEYEKEWSERKVEFDGDQPVVVSPEGAEITPNTMQVQALERLQILIEKGEKKALIISATGTGKTILSALAAREFNPKRLLFVAHTAQILRNSAREFQKVFGCPSSDIGFFVGTQRELDKKFVFATIQSISRIEHLTNISPVLFDYIIIDEVHRSGAESYKRVINHFRPKFLLGLTATPERTDGFNVFGLFDHNVPFEIRLNDALESHMLVPFDYYGVADYKSMEGYTITDTSSVEERVSEERVDHVARILQDYCYPSGNKGLIFCSSNREAALLAASLNTRKLYGRALRTVALSGKNTIQEREETVLALQDGKIDFIITVDIFNEGIDIPEVNVVVLLRSTQSSIIFTQQLGRGLRKADKKEALRVIDVIGNYANNYLIPIALSGDSSGNKENPGRAVRTRHPIAGASTVSFDKVTTERILESLQKARLVDKRKCKEAIENLKYRLGQIPRLKDFELHESLSPIHVANSYDPREKSKNYWSLLQSLKYVEVGPSEQEQRFLAFLSKELLNGKRPQELLLLQVLLEQSSISVETFAALLEERGLNGDENCLNSLEKILNLTWFDRESKKTKEILNPYGRIPLVIRDEDHFVLSDEFSEIYDSYAKTENPSPISFRDHVDDLIETGLYLNRKYYANSDQFVIGQRYSRKDACRILNWSKNQESVIYGYKVDRETMTCPIFVTYHKGSNISENVRYEDAFIDSSTLHWFTKHGWTLNKDALQPIINGQAQLHLFIKREDADGIEFYYLGQVDATNPQQTTMPGKQDKTLDVVTADLKLRIPIAPELFEGLTAAKSVAAPI